MADIDFPLLLIALVAGTLAIFHKWMARTFYPSQKAFGFKGSQALLEFTYLFGGAAMAVVAIVILLVEALR